MLVLVLMYSRHVAVHAWHVALASCNVEHKPSGHIGCLICWPLDACGGVCNSAHRSCTVQGGCIKNPSFWRVFVLFLFYAHILCWFKTCGQFVAEALHCVVLALHHVARALHHLAITLCHAVMALPHVDVALCCNGIAWCCCGITSFAMTVCVVLLRHCLVLLWHCIWLLWHCIMLLWHHVMLQWHGVMLL